MKKYKSFIYSKTTLILIGAYRTIQILRIKSVLFILIALLPSNEIYAMSILIDSKHLVFSEVNGQLLSHGKPVPNAKIIRKVEWQFLETDETTTDEQGFFHFQEVYQESTANLLPLEFVSAQSLEAQTGEELSKIWSNTKRSKDKNSELGGAPLNLTCELSNPLRLYRQFGSILRTKCTWK